MATSTGAAPAAPIKTPRYFDIAVTATADAFKGIYRGKKYHEPDFDAVLDRAVLAGVERVMLTGMSLSDVEFNLSVARSRPDLCRVTVGVHPYFAAEVGTSVPVEEVEAYWTSLIGHIDGLLQQQGTPRLLAAFGELGLDYDHLDKASREVQIEVFKRQLDIYVEKAYDIPLFLHCRSAFEDFRDVIQPYLSQIAPRKGNMSMGVVHSFVGNVSQMQTLVDMGFDISVNGFSFRTEESMQMVKAIPLDRLQIETDAPWGEIPAGSDLAKKYLAGDSRAKELPGKGVKKKDKFEVGWRVKERNESCAMERVALVVAGLKGLPVQEVAEAAWDNSWRMFEAGGAQNFSEEESSSS